MSQSPRNFGIVSTISTSTAAGGIEYIFVLEEQLNRAISEAYAHGAIASVEVISPQIVSGVTGTRIGLPYQQISVVLKGGRS